MAQDRYKRLEQNFDKWWGNRKKFFARRPLELNTSAAGIENIGSYILQYFNSPEYLEKDAE